MWCCSVSFWQHFGSCCICIDQSFSFPERRIFKWTDIFTKLWAPAGGENKGRDSTFVWIWRWDQKILWGVNKCPINPVGIWSWTYSQLLWLCPVCRDVTSSDGYASGHVIHSVSELHLALVVPHFTVCRSHRRLAASLRALLAEHLTFHMHRQGRCTFTAGPVFACQVSVKGWAV